MNNEQREQKIRAAIAERVAEGWKIRDCITRDPILKECCPLGALPGAEDLTHAYWIADKSLELNGFSDWVGSFMNGFDGRANNHIDPGAYAMGKQLRKEFIGL